MQPLQAIDKGRVQPDEKGQLNQLRQQVQLSELGDDVWWWD